LFNRFSASDLESSIGSIPSSQSLV
jgi:hypothetical protein